MKIKIDGIHTGWLATIEITDEEIDNISKGVDELFDLSDLEFEDPELKALIDLSYRLKAARNVAIAKGYRGGSMSTKHTPGPWYGLDGDWKSIVADAPYGDGLALVCRVAPLTYKGQDRHNKALILAAPALLEALELCFEELDSCDHEFEGTHYCGRCDSAIDRNHEIREKVARAIAKAKGY